MKTKWIISSCILLLFLSVLPLAAQDGLKSYFADDTVYVSADRNPRIPEYNSIAARVPLSLSKTPAAVQVVTETVMEDQGSILLSEAIKNISGVNVQTGNGTHDYFLVRGFNTLENGLMLTEGTPEPISTINNMYNVDRVEVLKGPGAFLYGGRALSGTINMVRKQAQFQNFAKASATGGSFNTMRGTIDLNLSNEKNLAFRLNGIMQQSDEYRDDMDSKVWGINPAFTWRPYEQGQLDVNFEYTDTRYQPDAGLPLLYKRNLLSAAQNVFDLMGMADVSREQSFQTPYDDSKQLMYRAKINYRHKLADNILLNERLYYTDQEWDSQGTLLSGAYDYGYGVYTVMRSMNILQDRQKNMGSQTELTFSWDFNNINYKLLAGIDMNRFTDEFTIDVIAQLPVLFLDNPVETFNGDISTAFPNQFGDATTVAFSPYVLNVIDMPQGINVIAGGRYDHASLDEELNNTERTYKQFSPMFGIGYSLCNCTYLYASAGGAFTPPSVRIIGERKPEESSQYEVGVKNEWLGGKIQSSVAVYSLEKENIAVPNQTGLILQNGSQKSQGVEFEVTAHVTPHCATFLSYSYTDAEMTEYSEALQVGQTDVGYPIYMYPVYSGNTAPFAPEHLFNFWHYREFGKLSVGFGVRYVSEQFIYYDNAYKLDSYYTLNASASYKIRNAKLFVHAKNLTSTEYEMRGFSSYSVIPAAPLAVYGGISVNLDSL